MTASAAPAAERTSVREAVEDGSGVPLVVDLDGSLLKTDMLYENFWAAMGRNPVRAIAASLRYLFDRPALKYALADVADHDPELLPYDENVLELCATARAQGRDVHIASGAAQPVVDRIAAHLGLDGPHFGSPIHRNLTGRYKADLLRETFDEQGFDYVADSARDLPVWQLARRSYVVRPNESLSEKLKANGIEAEPLGARWRLRDLARGLRLHQWIKNVLLFLPLVAAHRFDLAGFLAVLLGALAFSAAASSIYVVNDLLDLDADRRHATKHRRPFASGAVPIRIGMSASLMLALFALALAAAISPAMLVVIVIYLVTTLTYSLFLKRMRWIDIATLAALYTLRVLAGAVAAHVEFSGWLLALVYPVFLTLGCVKRLTELARADSEATLPGRAYARRDRGDLRNMAILGGVGAVLVFLMYSYSLPALLLYDSRFMLQLAAVPMTAWMARMIVTGWSGTQDYDPIVFALRDPQGLCYLALSLGCILASAGFIPSVF
jgi:4-hydroxybenzoate polyprenyltransferase/phosphoserine phosphatase